jgi:hypothetical protein
VTYVDRSATARSFCQGRERFDTREAAQAERDERAPSLGFFLRTIRCGECGGWHLKRPTGKRRRPRLRQGV